MKRRHFFRSLLFLPLAGILPEMFKAAPAKDLTETQGQRLLGVDWGANNAVGVTYVITMSWLDEKGEPKVRVLECSNGHTKFLPSEQPSFTNGV